MNPSAVLAAVLVDELARGGVREAVLSPGSRNAPLSYALHAADAAGRLRLHVRIDERTAGFLALGLAKASGSPVPVACTSGTAAANLHPAVLEASHSGVPLLVLTADRPGELQGTGANQTIEQARLYGGAVRSSALLSAVDGGAGDQATWRSVACRALAAAAGTLSGDPGPVHLDVALREPLVPGASGPSVEVVPGRPDGGPWTRVSGRVPSWAGPFDGDRALGSELARTLVVVGDCPASVGRAAARLADRRGWPLIAEPTGGAGASSLPHGPLLLGDAAFLAAHRPDRVLVVGRPTLSRPVSRLLADPEVGVEVVAASPRWADPARSARAVHDASWLEAALRRHAAAPNGTAVVDLGADAAPVGEAWMLAWREAAARAAAAVAEVLADAWPSGPRLARDLVAALPAESLLVLGSSSPVRDVDVAAAGRSDVRTLANRGVAGIDGTVSTAVGAALAFAGSAYALMGDLTFLHDANGLLIGPGEPRPDLCIVVLNDDGGGIFGQLEQGAPEHAEAFERIFGTPTGADLAALCAATRTPYRLVRTPEELRDALRPGTGIRVVEVPVDRCIARDLHARLRRAVTAALAP